MTNEQINIAIAEARGIVGPFENRWIKEYEMEGGDAYGLTGFEKDELVFVADYCNDLNAIHEAEGSLNSQQVQDYALNLLRVTNNDCTKFHGTLGCFAHIHATARQRAEAFLRTLGKWEGAQ